MEKNEKIFMAVLIVLLMIPIWGTLIPILGKCADHHDSPSASEKEKSTKKWHIGPDEAAVEYFSSKYLAD